MPSDEKVRIGIIGAGFAANFHVESLQKVYGVNVELYQL